MNIIKFAFEHWNYEYDWWHPNNFPLNFIVDGKKQLPFCHTFSWFDVGRGMISANDSTEFFDYPAIKSDLLHNYKLVKYLLLSDIKDSDKYIFPIMCNSWEYFVRNKDHGFNFIPNRVITDVQQGRAKILLLNPFEGFAGPPDWEILDMWCRNKSFQKDQVYYIHGNLNIPTNEYNFTYISIVTFYSYFSWGENTTIDYNPTSDKNLFLCYNRLTRRHRTVTVCEILKNNLFERGLISYYGKHNLAINLVGPDLLEYAKKLDSLVPITIDVDVSVTNPATDNVSESHYTGTFLSLVTETLVEDEVQWRYPDHPRRRYSAVFFSEKILKPIGAGHPFIVVSSQGTLKKLKEHGYQTFSKWWNEDYDNEENTDIRIKMIMEILVRLSKLSVPELKSIRTEMQSVLDHNRQLFKHNRIDIQKNHSMESLYTEVSKIWDSF